MDPLLLLLLPPPPWYDEHHRLNAAFKAVCDNKNAVLAARADAEAAVQGLRGEHRRLGDTLAAAQGALHELGQRHEIEQAKFPQAPSCCSCGPPRPDTCRAQRGLPWRRRVSSCASRLPTCAARVRASARARARVPGRQGRARAAQRRAHPRAAGGAHQTRRGLPPADCCPAPGARIQVLQVCQAPWVRYYHMRECDCQGAHQTSHSGGVFEQQHVRMASMAARPT